MEALTNLLLQRLVYRPVVSIRLRSVCSLSSASFLIVDHCLLDFLRQNCHQQQSSFVFRRLDSPQPLLLHFCPAKVTIVSIEWDTYENLLIDKRYLIIVNTHKMLENG